MGIQTPPASASVHVYVRVSGKAMTDVHWCKLALSYTMSLRAVISSCRAQLKESESLGVQIVSVRPRLHACMCKSPRKAQHINTLNLLLHVGEGLFHGYYFCSVGEDLLGDEM